MPNPIRKVLASMRAHRVRALLMGGQACVFYGAAEFSRDTDLAIVADAINLARLRRALDDLQAEVIAVPPLGPRHTQSGANPLLAAGTPHAATARGSRPRPHSALLAFGFEAATARPCRARQVGGIGAGVDGRGIR